MAHTILVADPNEGFGMLLAQELEQHGYQVETVTSSGEVLQALQARQPDMVVLDMELTDPDALSLARQLRAQYSAMRLMIIPYMGEEAPEEARSIPIQGVLPKPFFLPALPEQIEAALQAPLDGSVIVEVTSLHNAPPAAPPPPPQRSSPFSRSATPAPEPEPTRRSTSPLSSRSTPSAAPAPEPEPARRSTSPLSSRSTPSAAPAPEPVRRGTSPLSSRSTATSESSRSAGSGLSSRKWEKRESEIRTLMSSLAREVTADVVMLTVGEELALSVGRLADPAVQVLAQAVIQGRNTCLQIGRALGKESPCLEHNIAGKDFVLYALSVGGDAMLGVVIRGTSALGLLRHRSREAVEEIIRLNVF